MYMTYCEIVKLHRILLIEKKHIELKLRKKEDKIS